MRSYHFHEALGYGALAHEGQKHVVAFRDEPHLVVVGAEGEAVAHLVATIMSAFFFLSLAWAFMSTSSVSAAKPTTY